MNAEAALEEIMRYFDHVEPLDIVGLKPEKTALIMVDMINGFAVSGSLASERVGALIPEIARLSKKCDEQGIRKVALADCHTSYSAEFSSYPEHCLEGSQETEVVEAIKKIGGYTLVRKNSTNGFLEEEFLRFLGVNPAIDTFLIVGDCTDICILQLSLALKAHFNRLNLSSRVIVPRNAVDTYDTPQHNAMLNNNMALYNMMINGVEIVEKIK